MMYTPAFKPWAHQVEAMKRLAGQESFALLMAMRTGKTKVLLDDYGRLELAGEVQNLLVIAPGGVYKTWAGAATEHLSEDLRKRALVYCWKSSAGVKETVVFDYFMGVKDRPKIFLINVEALSSVKKACKAVIDFLDQGLCMAAIDESTIIKNPTSKRTKFINKEVGGRAEFRRILSGLPSPKSPLDLYSQFEFLDWRILGFKSFFAFRARYAIMQRQIFGGRHVQLVVGYKNIEELRAKIADHSYRVSLGDCYDLPPKMYAKREVPLTKEQTRLYAEMKLFATAKINETDHVTATIVIAQIMRLHQILCGHVVDEMGKRHAVPEYRTKTLLELLEDYDGKAIIWCSYDVDVRNVSENLVKEYGSDAVARFWGGNTSSREEEEKRFLHLPECRFMVATAAAGGRGRTWTVAGLVIYYSNTNDLEHRAQSEERAQGVGKNDSVQYIDLVAPGTVDEKIIHGLRNKIDMATAITGDTYREWLI